jgi:hypothetical protein
MAPVRPDVRAFFRRYERAAEDLDSEALTTCFCAVFLSLDVGSATTLSPQALLRRSRAASSSSRPSAATASNWQTSASCL